MDRPRQGGPTERRQRGRDDGRRLDRPEGRRHDRDGEPGARRRDGDDDGANLPVRRGRPEPADPIRRRSRQALPDFTGMVLTAAPAEAGFTDFLPVAQQIVNTPPSRARRMVGYVVCGAIAVALVASIVTPMRLFAIAPGEIESDGGDQIVQPPAAGQVSAMPVQNGAHVAAGATVLQLDPTAARAALTIVQAKLADARAEAFRHSSAAFMVRSGVVKLDAPLAWPKDIPADVRTREESVLRADLAQLAAVVADLEAKLATETSLAAKLDANIAAQKTLVDSRTKRTAMHQTLADQGWDSRATVLQSLEPLRQDEVRLTDYQGQLAQSKAAIPVLRDKIQATRETFIAENVAASAAAQREAAIEEQQLGKAKLALSELTLRAPVAGTIEAMSVTSLGQSVKVGDTLMKIAPDAAPLQVKAYVLNTDIGFVKVGQRAVVKIDTFPYTRYGTISGHVQSVGADAITGQLAASQQNDATITPTQGAMSVTNATQQTRDLVFPIVVALDRKTIAVDGRDVPLTSGMSVVAEVETARRRAITYLLYPLTRIFRRESGSF